MILFELDKQEPGFQVWLCANSPCVILLVPSLSNLVFLTSFPVFKQSHIASVPKSEVSL